MQIRDAARLIYEFNTIPKTKRKRTFMEISGYPHYENVCSNILQFFLNPTNEHELYDLVLISLSKLAQIGLYTEYYQGNISVQREVETINGGRLDLLIITKNYVIGIENKVFHFLDNDLKDYEDTIKAYCTEDKIPINIILHLIGFPTLMILN